MRALRLAQPGHLELSEITTPEISADEVLVRVAATGLCHSHLHILESADETWELSGHTLGHETAGHIAKVGADVTGYQEGDAVVLTLTWFCGHCRNCVQGKTNACLIEGTRTGFTRTPGVGPKGGVAYYIKVMAMHVDPIGDLDSVTAAPLADAGTTPMHAINSARVALTPDAPVVLIGVGGLGHLGLRILKATTASRIIALDTDTTKLDVARTYGADIVLPSDASAAEKILELTDGAGADVVFDFVGVQPTVTLARSVVANRGALRIVGLVGGSFEFTADGSGDVLPGGVNVQRSNGGTHQDPREVLALAQGKRHVETVTYPLGDSQTAVDDLHHGRAVLIR